MTAWQGGVSAAPVWGCFRRCQIESRRSVLGFASSSTTQLKARCMEKEGSACSRALLPSRRLSVLFWYNLQLKEGGCAVVLLVVVLWCSGKHLCFDVGTNHHGTCGNVKLARPSTACQILCSVWNFALRDNLRLEVNSNVLYCWYSISKGLQRTPKKCVAVGCYRKHKWKLFIWGTTHVEKRYKW